MADAIIVENISKSYGSVKALKRVSFAVQEGEIFGLIGPDGAGRSTLFRILATLILPDEGSATMCGLNVVDDYHQLRTRIGYMPGRFSLYPDLSVEENISFFSNIFGVTLEQNYDLVAPIYRQIEPFRRRRAGALSGGMKQKLALCCALIHKPEVSRAELWDMLALLRQQHITILASTAYMDEASRCDRIALMSEGDILEICPPHDNLEEYFIERLRVNGQ